MRNDFWGSAIFVSCCSFPAYRRHQTSLHVGKLFGNVGVANCTFNVVLFCRSVRI